MLIKSSQLPSLKIIIHYQIKNCKKSLMHSELRLMYIKQQIEEICRLNKSEILL